MQRNCPQCYEYIDKIKELKEHIIFLTAVKSKDKISLERQDKYSWKVVTHRKDKHTLQVKELTHIIKDSDVIYIRGLIDELWNVQKVIESYELWLMLIKRKNLQIDINSFNGGKNRAKYYFPLYYYPIKILEYIGYIIYDSKGKIWVKD